MAAHGRQCCADPTRWRVQPHQGFRAGGPDGRHASERAVGQVLSPALWLADLAVARLRVRAPLYTPAWGGGRGGGRAFGAVLACSSWRGVPTLAESGTSSRSSTISSLERRATARPSRLAESCWEAPRRPSRQQSKATMVSRGMQDAQGIAGSRRARASSRTHAQS